ncbi:MAG TPA: hypothetical protein VNU97_05190 [Rhizomicrobium sp.]|nr:hypothetical protein [Rhizomicrobium sp.]
MIVVLFEFALATGAKAMDVTFDSYLDARLVVPAGEKSWLDGGLGKFRFGAGQPSPDARLVEAVGQATLALTDELHAVGVLRLEPEQRSGLDVLETYLAWRPAASGDWRWSLKAGAFFPPISLENDDLGWTSPYTLTPSAIDSWVGEELRTVGGEGTLEHRAAWGTLSATGALFCCNEPAGVIIAARGWALDDRPTGLFERLKLPDVSMSGRAGLFENVDGDVGWYAKLRVELPDLGQLALLRYDNDADPNAFTARDASWRTRFWSLSLKTRLAGVALLAQGLTGDTAIGDGLGDLYVTRFASAFVLASYDFGDWRVSGRAEVFQTRAVPSAPAMDEDGHAVTAALLWNARAWLRLSAELIALDSRRGERVLEGLAPAQDDAQFQLGARVFL